MFLKKEISNANSAGWLKFFVKNWQKVPTNPVSLSCVEGYKISLVEIISQNFSSPQVSKKEEEELIMQDEIKEILKKNDSFSGKQTRAICKLNFHSSKEILKFWLVISLNNLNSYVEYNQFKMESLFVLNELLGRGIISAN